MKSAGAPAGGSLRARRWDVIVLGSALPGLVAAVRLAMQGQRVLVVEEEAATRTHPALRDPFLITGNGGGGVFDSCLRALTVPLIDRKKIEADPIAFQVVMPDRRIDIGEPQVTLPELVTWGLAKPDEARDLVRALLDAAAAERTAMLEAPIVRGSALRSIARSAAGAAAPRPARHGRGLPVEVSSAGPELAALLDAQVQSLTHLAEASPPPEAKARLLGSALEGGATANGIDGLVRPLLRRRLQALFGEFRSVAGRFDFVTVGQQPGIAAAGAFDVWVSRALVLNAPRSALAQFVSGDGGDAPEFLDAAKPTRQRIAIWLRGRGPVLPEGIARRVLRIADPQRPLTGTNLIRLSVAAPSRASDLFDLLVSASVPIDADVARVEDALEAAVHELMPFAGDRLVREPIPPARWDTDLLADPASGESWPGELEIRLSSRPPIFCLPREGVAALGFEGDVLLGWRAGDVIRAELGAP